MLKRYSKPKLLGIALLFVVGIGCILVGVSHLVDFIVSGFDYQALEITDTVVAFILGASNLYWAYSLAKTNRTAGASTTSQ